MTEDALRTPPVLPGPPSRRAFLGWPVERWELVLAAWIITFRLTWYLSDEGWAPWRDWVLLVSAYWIFVVVGRRSRAWPWVTLVLMGGLLAVYLSRQLPLTYEALLWNLWP